MGWITVYIRGKSGFKDEVLRNLEHSRFRFMPGSAEERNVCLFWIDDRAPLREFKKAIGSKTIFKYRLRFYASVEEFIESKSNVSANKFTQQEQSMIHEMHSWQAEQRTLVKTGTDN